MAKLIGMEMDAGCDARDALKNVVEKKLMGTWKMAMIEMDQPK